MGQKGYGTGNSGLGPVRRHSWFGRDADAARHITVLLGALVLGVALADKNEDINEAGCG